MADDEATTANSLSHARRQPPLSLNQRHNRILSDLSAATLPRHITKTSSGGENNDGDGERGCLDQAFSVVAEHDDVPSFSGIADFDSPSPPPPYLDEDAQIQSNLGAEEAVEVRNFSGFNDCDSSFPFPSDSINTSMLNDGVLEEDGHACGLNESNVFGIKNSFQNQEGEVDKMHSTKGLSISGSEDSVHNSQVYEIAEKEDKVEKVRIKGRRRLCKLVNKDDNCAREVNHTITDAEDSEITDFHSPTLVKGSSESNYSGGGGNEIRDILNDLTSKFDILSIEKPRKPERADLTKEFKHQSTIKVDRAKNKEGIPEYESAASAFSISSDSSLGSDMESSVQRVPFIERGKKHNFDDEDKSKKIALGVKADGIKKNAKSISTRHSTRPIDLNKRNEEYDDDDCVLIDEVVAKKAERGLEKVKNGCSNAYEVDEEDKVYDDYVLEQEQTVSLGKKVTFRLSGRISKILFPHQRDGLKWLWLLHSKGKGGILGDDMGLGKTMQICSFLAGLFYSRLIKRVLVVAPKTLLPHWTKELSVVGLSRETREYFGTNVNARQYELQYVLQDKGVLLTTYDIVRHNATSLSGNHYYGHDGGSEDDFMWDYLILDEGHLIKNPSTQRAKSLLMIPAAHRIIISGTPLQNNLKELWALFNFCCPEILGDYKWFKDKYEKLINRGNEKNASEREKRVGSTVAKDLRETIQPYFLRRLKSDVFEDDAEGSKLSKKKEIIVWLKLTTCQRRIYEAFLKSEIVLSAFDGSPLAALTILKKICDHPLLLTKRAAEDVLEGMDSMLSPQDHSVAEKLAMHIADDAETFDVDKHDVSCKITFIMSLLDDLIPKGHHVLIFSQTRKMLNLIQESLSSNGYEFMRIDGTTKACDRLKIVNDFQGAHGAPIFLLTSQVGGLGLTLTKADRVIVVDPAWNPSTDNQSVDRAYRIGQTKDVIVYRLMTCGTVEEKIYRMQIFKGGLFRSATEHKEQTRYFSKQDLRELFSLPKQGFDISLTQKQMLEEHDQQHMMEESLKDHVSFLESLGIAGVSQHSLLFSKSAPVADAQEEEVLGESGRPCMNSASQSHSYSQDPNGGQFAFRPKDVSLQQKKSSPSSNEPTEEEIRERMNRLSQIFADKGTVLKLPDKGERIRKQISDLELELEKVQVSKRSENKTASLEEVSEDFQRILNIKM